MGSRGGMDEMLAREHGRDENYALPYFSTALFIPGKPSARSWGVIDGSKCNAGIECKEPGLGNSRHLSRVLHVEEDVGCPLTAFFGEVGCFRLQVGQNLLDRGPEGSAFSCCISGFNRHTGF